MKKLQSYIQRTGISKKVLAKRCGVSFSAVYNWEAGRSYPGVRQALRLERVTKGAVSVYDWK